MPRPIGLPNPLRIQPIVMRPVMPPFYDSITGVVVNRNPEQPEKQKPFSDILKKK